MSLNSLGLGMIISAKDMASGMFQRVGKSIGGARAKVQKFAAGLGQAAQAAQGAAMAFAPFTLGLGYGVKTAADFEQGLRNVQGVMLASDEAMEQLGIKAKQVGARTSFSAVQATEGLENLARAGFDSTDAITALDAVVNAAAAEGITDLGSATNTVVTALKSMGKDAKEATHVADVLAITSARTNTNMTLLGEGFKMAGPQAKILGVSLEDTAMALGMLADAGLKGTMGGTSLNAMLTKLARPSAAALRGFKKLGVEIKDSKGNMLPLGDIMLGVGNNITKMGGNLDQAKFLMEAFDIRGSKAATNLASRMSKMAADVDANGVSKLQKFAAEIRNADGAAEKMASIRLKSLKGAFTILGSSVEGVLIEGFTPFVQAMGPMVKTFADFIGDIAQGVSLLGSLVGGNDAAAESFGKLNPVVQSIAMGIYQAMTIIKNVFNQVVEYVNRLGQSITDALGPDGVTTITRYAVLLGVVLGVIAPIAASFAGLAYVISSVVIPAATSLSTMLGPLLGPWGILAAGVVAILWGLRDRIAEFGAGLISGLEQPWESVKASLSGIWSSLLGMYDGTIGAISAGLDRIDLGQLGEDTSSIFGGTFATIMELAQAAVEGFASGWDDMSPAISYASEALVSVWDAIIGVVEALGLADGASEGTKEGVSTFGEVVGGVFGVIVGIVGVAAHIIVGAINIVGTVVGGVVDLLSGLWTIVVTVVEMIAAVFAGDWATVWAGAKTIVFEVIKGIIVIVGTLVQGVAAAVDAIGKIFGKDLGARKFMKGVQDTLIGDVEKMIKGQEQIARERKDAAAKQKAKAAPAPAPGKPPKPGAPLWAAAMPGQDGAQTAAIDRLGASIRTTPIQANIDITSKIMMDQLALGEAVEKVQKDLKAREGR